MIWWFFFLSICFFSFLLTSLLRRYALFQRMVDIPNERSSHTVPTPRGGGVAIVLTVLTGLLVFKIWSILPASLFTALMGAGAWIALIGWLDDRWELSAKSRLIGHFIGAGWALFWIGGLPPLSFLGYSLNLGWIGYVFASFYLVWLLNLYNFMDGIDGIAGIEAITVCIGSWVLWTISQAGGMLWILPVLLAVATAGFLFWNFPRAKIFMGDAGSGFIGIILGILSIQAGWIAPELYWGWVILLGAFVMDATVTLLRRAWRGQKIYEAHCSHAYQHAARRFKSHLPVSFAFGAINLFWLLPIAALVTAGMIDGVLGVIVAYVPLGGAAFFFEAGQSG